MIKDNIIIFKNPRVEELLEIKRRETLQYGLSTPEAMKQLTKKTMQEQGESIIVGYWFSLLEEAMMERLRMRKWIDFSYETIERLPYSLISLYMLQKAEGYTRERNTNVIGKTIGAVMYGLAMNEHGYSFTVKKGKKGPMWGDFFSISVDGIQKVDFLYPALQTVSSSQIIMQKGAFVDMNPIIRAYQIATGIDLSEHGLGNIVIDDMK